MISRKNLPLVAIALVFPLIAAGADSPVKSFVSSLKGKELVMKAHEDLFGPSQSGWDGRLIQEADVVLAGDAITIGGTTGWAGQYFVSDRTYFVKEAKLDKGKDRIQIKVWQRNGLPLEPEIKINIAGASRLSLDQLNQALFSLFFAPGESKDAHIAANDEQLLKSYIDREPELFLLSTAERLKVLKAIRSISFSGRPQLERLPDGLYIPAAVVGDTSVYNDLQVNKNARIASSCELVRGTNIGHKTCWRYRRATSEGNSRSEVRMVRLPSRLSERKVHLSYS
jgi:hypothetical protein